MFTPLLNVIMQYAGAVAVGIFVGLMAKAYFASKFHNKIRNYQGEIVKSHEKILELEALNYRLEKKLKDIESAFIKEKLVMN